MEMNQIKNVLDYWIVTSWLLYPGENHPKKKLTKQMVHV